MESKSFTIDDETFEVTYQDVKRYVLDEDNDLYLEFHESGDKILIKEDIEIFLNRVYNITDLTFTQEENTIVLNTKEMFELIQKLLSEEKNA